jgi:hypothetical protein
MLGCSHKHSLVTQMCTKISIITMFASKQTVQAKLCWHSNLVLLSFGSLSNSTAVCCSRLSYGLTTTVGHYTPYCASCHVVQGQHIFVPPILANSVTPRDTRFQFWITNYWVQLGVLTCKWGVNKREKEHATKCIAQEHLLHSKWHQKVMVHVF